MCAMSRFMYSMRSSSLDFVGRNDASLRRDTAARARRVMTAAYWCDGDDFIEASKCVLRGGGEVPTHHEGMPLLCVLAARSQLDAMRFLLDEGANPLDTDPRTGGTPLHFAAGRAVPPVYGELLTRCPALLHATDNLNNVAFYYAMGTRDDSLLHFLRAGLDPMKPVHNTTTVPVVEIVCRGGHVKSLQYLLEISEAVRGMASNCALMVLAHAPIQKVVSALRVCRASVRAADLLSYMARTTQPDAIEAVRMCPDTRLPADLSLLSTARVKDHPLKTLVEVARRGSRPNAPGDSLESRAVNTVLREIYSLYELYCSHPGSRLYGLAPCLVDAVSSFLAVGVPTRDEYTRRVLVLAGAGVRGGNTRPCLAAAIRARFHRDAGATRRRVATATRQRDALAARSAKRRCVAPVAE